MLAAHESRIQQFPCPSQQSPMSLDNSASSWKWLTSAWRSASLNTFQLDQDLGKGARGTTWLFQGPMDRSLMQRFVVKYANNNVAVPTIENKIRFLQVSRILATAMVHTHSSVYSNS